MTDLGDKTGAPPSDAGKWRTTDWSALEANVRRLQVRIAKAAKQKRWGNVKSLQHILVTSNSARLLAVRKVTSNKGKNTSGIDGVVWKSPTAKYRAAQTLGRRGYKAQPLKRIYIPKANGKRRALGIPTMKDRAMQALYAMALKPIAEVTADGHSYGFRPRRCAQDAIEQCHIMLARGDRAQWILEADIRSCFDQIDHQWMLDHIPMDKFILRQWLEAGFIEADVFYETTEGTPQGGIASPILANMALDGLQRTIADSVPAGSKVNFVRYADDFIVTARDPRILEDIVKPVIQVFLADRGLELSKEKTLITHIDRGFNFLGYNIRKFDGKLLIQPQKEKVKGFKEKLKRCIRALRFKPAHYVIRQLNDKIRGWARYYRNCCASKTFRSIDHYVFQTIWRELRRRHSQHSAKWVKKTYFTSTRVSNWAFFGVECRGDWRRQHLLRGAASYHIRRHIKILATATPYDPELRDYFRKRKGMHIAGRIKDRLGKTPTIRPWQRYPKNQLELFATGLRKQP